jgi:hypothetical protein
MAMDEQQTPETSRVEAALKGITRELNSKGVRPAPLAVRSHNEGVPRFVELTDKLFDAAIEAAQRQVTRAQNLLKQIESEAEEARNKAKTRWEELQQLERDLEDMSSEMLQSFNRHKGK